MKVNIEPSWHEVLKDEFEKPYFNDLVSFVKSEYKNQIIYPKAGNIFRAFSLCPFDKLKIVVIGQDPYHGPGQANGLSFSVNDGIAFPPSLRNIFIELENDLGIKCPSSGNLDQWAKQGVLLLNATLTVRHKQPGSHQGKGWETFTDAVVDKINLLKENIVFILWGSYAQQKCVKIDVVKHKVISSAHPSPFSAHRGFFGSKPFSVANSYLKQIGLEPVNW